MYKKNRLLLVMIILTSINSYSQIIFEKGYFINNANEKIDCLIKNIDWSYNPTDFEYKLSENSTILKNNIKNTKEFGIYDISKYYRAIVDIDRSSENLNDLNTNKKPEFKKETLFLKVLIEGDKTLYTYTESNLKRYFYNKDDLTIDQLVYKKYKVSKNLTAENNYFKQQILNNLKCTSIDIKRIKSLSYSKKSLTNLFLDYNKCVNPNYTSYYKKQKKDAFKVTIRPRFNSSSLSLENPKSSILKNVDFGNKSGFGIGIKLEYILLFNKNKWSISLEPTYQSYESEKTSDANNVAGGVLVSSVSYSSIEIPFTLRHYFFLNNDSKIFISASYILDINSGDVIDFKRGDNSDFNTVKIHSGNNLAFGVGYKFYNKFSLELRQQTTRNVLNNINSWKADYKTLSIILGYTIF